MYRSLVALTGVLAVTFLAGACSQASPTSPTAATTDGAIVGAVSQETPSVPAAVVPAPGRALGATRFLAFGDSITYGTLSSPGGLFLYADEPGSYPRLLRSMLNSYNAPQQFSVVNEGVPGERASQGEQRMPGVLSQHQPESVLLLMGVNDLLGGVSPDRAAASVAQLVQIARLYNCTVLVALMPQTYESWKGDNAREQIVPFNTEVRRLVQGQQNVHIVDLYTAFGVDHSLIGDDGLHPSPAGYVRMAQTFHTAIQAVFPVRGSLQ